MVRAAGATLLINDSSTFPLGNTLCRTIVATMTAGTARMYPLTPVDRNSITAKYVANRTTELSASAVVISFVGTKCDHDDGENNTDGSLNQICSDILLFMMTFYHAVSSVSEPTFSGDVLRGSYSLVYLQEHLISYPQVPR